jgi:predicted phosphodiesterase
MRRFFQFLLVKPVLWMANRFSSKPDLQRVHAALSKLLQHIVENPGKRGLVLNVDQFVHKKFIIFSDHHKGAKNGADDFRNAEDNYLRALDYYYSKDFCYVSLGDCEELWENLLTPVKKNNQSSIEKEKLFLNRGAYIKIFGNHDVFWNNDPLADWQLKRMYGSAIKIYEGLILIKRIKERDITIFLTHGHQGDGQSDGNKFSAWFVSRVWGPLQSYLQLNPNTPAYDAHLKTEHNHFMYEWSAKQKDLLLVTGHTHQPVFESLTHLERLYRQLLAARESKNEKAITELEEQIRFRRKEYDHIATDYLKMKPTYFNTGCCCFTDGDITGIEIEGNDIRLVKWLYENGASIRRVLEQINLGELVERI